MLSNGALKFSRVTLGDAGTYQCVAKNEAGVAVGRTVLVLQGKEVICDVTDTTTTLLILRGGSSDVIAAELQ